MTHLEVDRVAQRAAQWPNCVGHHTVLDEHAKDVQRLLHLRCHREVTVGNTQALNDSIQLRSSLNERSRSVDGNCLLRCAALRPSKWARRTLCRTVMNESQNANEFESPSHCECLTTQVRLAQHYTALARHAQLRWISSARMRSDPTVPATERTPTIGLRGAA